MTFQVMTLLMSSTFGIWQDKEYGDQTKDRPDDGDAGDDDVSSDDNTDILSSL
jgi:hypothetical protein